VTTDTVYLPATIIRPDRRAVNEFVSAILSLKSRCLVLVFAIARGEIQMRKRQVADGPAIRWPRNICNYMQQYNKLSYTGQIAPMNILILLPGPIYQSLEKYLEI